MFKHGGLLHHLCISLSSSSTPDTFGCGRSRFNILTLAKTRTDLMRSQCTNHPKHTRVAIGAVTNAFEGTLHLLTLSPCPSAAFSPRIPRI